MTEWLVRYGGKPPIGPVTTELLCKGIESGRVPFEAEACRKGSHEWKPLASYDEFMDAFDSDDAMTRVTDAPWLLDPMFKSGPLASASVPAPNDDDDDDDELTHVAPSSPQSAPAPKVGRAPAPRPAAGVPAPRPASGAAAQRPPQQPPGASRPQATLPRAPNRPLAAPILSRPPPAPVRKTSAPPLAHPAPFLPAPSSVKNPAPLEPGSDEDDEDELTRALPDEKTPNVALAPPARAASAPMQARPAPLQMPGAFPPPAQRTPLPESPVVVRDPTPTSRRPQSFGPSAADRVFPQPSYTEPGLDLTSKILIFLIVLLSIGLVIVLYLLWQR